jgi:hypothetical protein
MKKLFKKLKKYLTNLNCITAHKVENDDSLFIENKLVRHKPLPVQIYFKNMSFDEIKEMTIASLKLLHKEQQEQCNQTQITHSKQLTSTFISNESSNSATSKSFGLSIIYEEDEAADGADFDMTFEDNNFILPESDSDTIYWSLNESFSFDFQKKQLNQSEDDFQSVCTRF